MSKIMDMKSIGDQLTTYATTLQLIDELKKESQRIEKENNNLKLEFIRNISHEFRTPLNAIMGSYQLLKNTDLSKAELDELLDRLTFSSFRLVENCEKLLQVSIINNHIKRNSKTKFRIEELFCALESKHYISAQIKNLNLKLISYCTLELNCDFDAIFMVISELISNSINFTKKGYVLITVQKQGSLIEFIVKDSGIGISDKVKKELFSLFNKDENNCIQNTYGLGLGLYIVNKLAMELKAKVTYKSSKTLGTEFAIRLPIE